MRIAAAIAGATTPPDLVRLALLALAGAFRVAVPAFAQDSPAVIQYGAVPELVTAAPLRIFIYSGQDVSARNEILKHLRAGMAIELLETHDDADAVFSFARDAETVAGAGVTTYFPNYFSGGVTGVTASRQVNIEQGVGSVFRLRADTVRYYFSWSGTSGTQWKKANSPKAFAEAFLKDWRNAVRAKTR